ncbi:MAG TPA: FAD-dependent oxidoreductase [Candidatus Dormibacteraeota bacterium]|nr:FAD-dependent oxidoreductase [Candidatus Dormibacteraeota bacterium]
MVVAPPARVGTPEQAVIVGAGPAGDAVAAGLRDAGFEGRVVLVGGEPEAPYERPHLSKGYLLGTVTRERLPLRPAAQYRERGIDLVLGRRVVDLGVERRRVELQGGETIPWDRLCIATGSEARRLPGFDGAIYLRELPEADRLRQRIARGEPLSIIGAGFIGCEVASVARQRGCEVHVYEPLEQPMLRVLGAEAGAYLADLHRTHGVDLHLGIRSIPPVGENPLVAVGSAPRVPGGLEVDELGRTSDDGVWGAGDVTRFYHPLFERHIRVEHFQTSQRHGYAVGRAMAGAGEPYREVPWFWSDQYDLNLQYIGAGLPWDEIVTRGEFGRPPFTVFYLSGGELVGAAGFNDHHTVARARRVMETRRSVSVQQLVDQTFDLRRALA